jgi:hypothetical protein
MKQRSIVACGGVLGILLLAASPGARAVPKTHERAVLSPERIAKIKVLYVKLKARTITSEEKDELLENLVAHVMGPAVF